LQFALDEPKVVQQFFCSGSLFHGFDRKQQNLTIFSISCQNSLETNGSDKSPNRINTLVLDSNISLNISFLLFSSVSGLGRDGTDGTGNSNLFAIGRYSRSIAFF